MKRVPYMIVFLLVSIAAIGQDANEQNNDRLSRFFKETDPLHTNNLALPIFSFGTGILSFRGDIETYKGRNISRGLPGFHFELSQTITPDYSIGFRYLHGTLYGDSYIPGTDIICNFQTQISTFSTFLEYNFFSSRRLTPYYHRTVSPFVRIGIEILQNPEPWGDLYEGDKKLYRWTDGSYRDIPQDAATAYQSQIIYRDYSYESSYYREQIDITDTRRIPLTASIPLEIGAEFRVSPQFHITMGYHYHFTFSNKLDNAHRQGNLYEEIPTRKISAMPDRFSYVYIGIRYNINNKKFDLYRDSLPITPSTIYFWDADGDGVCETIDKCPFTPPGVEVDEYGCPIHTSQDYKAPHTQRNPDSYMPYKSLNTEISKEELLERMYSEKTLLQDEIYRYFPNLLAGGTVYRQFYRRIPPKFRAIDRDTNQYIDIEELLHAIDTFFDMGPDAGVGAQLTVKDLFELIEFFFLQ